MNENSSGELLELAALLVKRALASGCDVAEASARSGWELSARVRLGETELVEEAGRRSVSLRVIKDQRVAATSTSDLTAAGIDRCISDARMMVELSEPDPFAGPAEPELLCSEPHPDLELFDEGVSRITADEAIERARRAEKAARDYDARLTLSEGATFSRTESTTALVLSTGFSGSVRGSYASLVVSPVAEDTDGKRRRGFYWTGGRHLAALEDDEEVGREAARRTLGKLGAKKVPTCEAPVIFDRDVARSLIGTFAGCILGGSVWRKSTYLLDREGSQVAAEAVSIVDDPLVKRAPGSAPFDGEGLRTRRNVVVQDGMLKTFLLDCYSARKLGRTSTASASRGGGSIGASSTNFFMLPGREKREDVILATERGLYVMEMMGFGFNGVTGDFSRGASGFWIENGRLAFPVSEITISSNLDTMLKSIDRIADDLDLKTSVASPTFRISSMTIAGT